MWHHDTSPIKNKSVFVIWSKKYNHWRQAYHTHTLRLQDLLTVHETRSLIRIKHEIIVLAVIPYSVAGEYIYFINNGLILVNIALYLIGIYCLLSNVAFKIF